MSSPFGFTLIELLLVVSIISLLSSVIFAVTGTARARAEATQRVANIRSINTANALYFSENGAYPLFNPDNIPNNAGGIAWSNADPTSGNLNEWTNVGDQLVNGGFISSFPDTTTGNYGYFFPAGWNTPVILTILPPVIPSYGGGSCQVPPNTIDMPDFIAAACPTGYEVSAHILEDTTVRCFDKEGNSVIGAYQENPQSQWKCPTYEGSGQGYILCTTRYFQDGPGGECELPEIYGDGTPGQSRANPFVQTAYAGICVGTASLGPFPIPQQTNPCTFGSDSNAYCVCSQ